MIVPFARQIIEKGRESKLILKPLIIVRRTRIFVSVAQVIGQIDRPVFTYKEGQPVHGCFLLGYDGRVYDVANIRYPAHIESSDIANSRGKAILINGFSHQVSNAKVPKQCSEIEGVRLMCRS